MNGAMEASASSAFMASGGAGRSKRPDEVENGEFGPLLVML